MIVIVDCKVSNLGSVINAVKKVTNNTPVVSSDPGVITRASRLILPGVGSFDHGMKQLRQAGLDCALRESVRSLGTPLLGICLGMQLLTTRSEEGVEPGLALIPARTVRFGSGSPTWVLRVPHMGWNRVHPIRKSLLFDEMYAEPRFYFVHSYHLICDEPAISIATARYGYDFSCAVNSGTVYGVQFHPEKSHKFGLKLLQNFLSGA
jgi:glutamine amidotransferase